MAKYERERKFLLVEAEWEKWKGMSTGCRRMVQGYLSRRKESTVRVRISGVEAWLTVKGITSGDTREEYEYPIPLEDAERMMLMCEGGIVEKTRWLVPFGGLMYEVDIFEGRHDGLKICEVELPDDREDMDWRDLPPFAGEEVTGDPRYYNSNL